MRFAGWIRCAVGIVALVAFPALAMAASFNCHDARGPVETTICADTQLSQFDSELATSYAMALARDPAQAEALRVDEQDWLGERDDRGWRWLSSTRLGTSYARALLSQLYSQRITFLQNVANPVDEWHSPATRIVISNALALPAGSGNVLQRFEDAGLVSLPRPRRFENLHDLMAAMPAVPDSVLLAALQTRADGARFGLTYLPDSRLGGVLESDASGCAWWVPFRVSGKAAGDVFSPRVEWWGCPALSGRFGSIGSYPVVLSQRRGPGWTELRWWRWSGGESGPPVQVRIRFARDLQIGNAACAAPWPCDALRSAALDSARRFDARPLPGTLAGADSIDPENQVAYQQMLVYATTATRRVPNQIATAWSSALGPFLSGHEVAGEDVQMLNQKATAGLPGFGGAGQQDIPGWFGANAVYFAAPVAGRLLLGRIGHPWLGLRVLAAEWMVGYWSWNGSSLTPVAGFIIDRKDGKPLLAARVRGLGRGS